MKFYTITLKGIRNFDEKTIEFGDGLNIVCGPNESGKSTILDAALYCITGIEDVPTLVGWDAEYSCIDLEYKTDTGHVYTLSRTLYPEEKSRLENTTIVENPESISAIVEDHFGSSDRVVLENSSFVRHNEMEILRKMDSKEVIKRQMQLALTGTAQRTTEEVIKILEDSIEDVRESVKKLEYAQDDVQWRMKPYATVEDEYLKLATRLEVYRGDLGGYQAKYDVYSTRLDYETLFTDIEETQKKVEHIEDIEGYIAAIPFDEVEKIEELQKETQRIGEGMESLTLLIREREDELGKLRLGRNGEGKRFLKWFSSLFGRQKKKEDIDKRVCTLEEELKNFRRDFYELERKLEDIRVAQKNIINRVGEYKGKGLDYLTRTKEAYTKEIDDILQGLTREEVVTLLSQKREDADRLRSTIFRLSPELLERDVMEVCREKEKLEEKIGILKKEIEDSEEELKDVLRRKREKERIQRESNALNAQKDDLSIGKAIDEIVLNTLHSVYAELKDLFIPQLEEKTSKILHKITRGKYKTISIRREDLEISVKLQDKSVNIRSLSQGTKDQLYFAMRIALSDLLSGGRNLPLLFDESFYTSDEKRLEETFTVLKEIAINTQVILFTHNENFLEHGNPIILESGKEDSPQLY